jgi:hypothetical protein
VYQLTPNRENYFPGGIFNVLDSDSIDNELRGQQMNLRAKLLTIIVACVAGGASGMLISAGQANERVNTRVADADTPDIPDVDTPDSPDIPEVDTPASPYIPEVDTPDSPDIPEVDTPDTPDIPEVDTPDSPDIPEVDTPASPYIPEVDTPDSPDTDKPD